MVNPYESPRDLEERPTWLDWLRGFFRGFTPLTLEQRFECGDWLIHYGVLFRIDRNDRGALFAALPIATLDDEHVRRNVEEAVRVYPEFLEAYPSLARLVRGRSLVVTMFESYERPSEVLQTRVVDVETLAVSRIVD